jgi:hypothetical protein
MIVTMSHRAAADLIISLGTPPGSRKTMTANTMEKMGIESLFAEFYAFVDDPLVPPGQSHWARLRVGLTVPPGTRVQLRFDSTVKEEITTDETDGWTVPLIRERGWEYYAYVPG